MRKQKQPKGASPLHLDLHELRWQLSRADDIINYAYQLLDTDGTAELKFRLIEDDITTYRDPLFIKSRQQAMHRIKPKRDYVIIALMLAVAFLVITNIASKTENDLLTAELEQIKYQQRS